MPDVNNFIEAYYFAIAGALILGGFLTIYLKVAHTSEYYAPAQAFCLVACCIWPASIAILVIMFASIFIVVGCQYAILGITNTLDFILKRKKGEANGND